MSVINELIRTEENGNISFGNYSLDVKSKAEDFEHDGDLYKVKTFKEITKLERNGMFVYESVPGTAVTDFSVKDTEVSFKVEGTLHRISLSYPSFQDGLRQLILHQVLDGTPQGPCPVFFIIALFHQEILHVLPGV